MEQPDRPVAIQVGGKTFACRLSTLFKYPEALLWKAYSFDTKHFDLTFWDRNPRVFACLLDFYRTNRLTLPSDVSLRMLKEELGFWGFDIAPPERPPWPVLPPRDLAGGAPAVIRYPLGLALRDSASGCHCVLLCVVWSALGKSSAVWEAAQRGHRSICVYWKTRAPGMDSALLKSHARILQNLAELDNCSLQILPEVTTSLLHAEVRNHDVYTNGHMHSTGPVTHVAEWKFEASYFREGHELVLLPTSSEKMRFTFDHGGFRVTLQILGERIWWYMNPLVAGEESVGEEPDVRALENARGFLLEVSFVLGTTVFTAFLLPSSYYRTSNLRADIFLSQTFREVPDDKNWYQAPFRHTLPYDTSPFDFGSVTTPSQTTEIVLLVEQKENVELACHPIGSIAPLTPGLSFSPSSYDRFLISW